MSQAMRALLRVVSVAALAAIALVFSMLLGGERNQSGMTIGVPHAFADAPAVGGGKNPGDGTQCESGDGDAGSSCCY